MILLDTHIWIWWVDGNAQLPAKHKRYLESNQQRGLGVSIMSCWEVAKLVQKNKLKLPRPVFEWIRLALNYPGINLLNLTPAIVVDSTELPGTLKTADPADQLLVATARTSKLTLMTVDSKILEYPHVAVWKNE